MYQAMKCDNHVDFHEIHHVGSTESCDILTSAIACLPSHASKQIMVHRKESSKSGLAVFMLRQYSERLYQ